MAMEFNGTSSIVDCTDIELLGEPALSISAWFNFGSSLPVSGARRIVSKDRTGVIGCFLLFFESPTGLLRYQFQGIGELWKAATFDVSSFNDNKWHNAVGTMSTSLLSLHVDGVTGTNGAMDRTVRDDDNEKLVIGGDSNVASTDGVWVGGIDDVRLYKRTLSLDDAISIYRGRGRDRLTEGLYSRWLLNEGADGQTASGSVVKDSMGNADGTAQGGCIYRPSELTLRRPT